MPRPRTGKGERVVIKNAIALQLETVMTEEGFDSLGETVNDILRRWLKCRNGEDCSNKTVNPPHSSYEPSTGVSLDINLDEI